MVCSSNKWKMWVNCTRESRSSSYCRQCLDAAGQASSIRRFGHLYGSILSIYWCCFNWGPSLVPVPTLVEVRRFRARMSSRWFGDIRVKNTITAMILSAAIWCRDTVGLNILPGPTYVPLMMWLPTVRSETQGHWVRRPPGLPYHFIKSWTSR